MNNTQQIKERQETLDFMEQCNSTKKKLEDLRDGGIIDASMYNGIVNPMYREANAKWNSYYEKYRVSVNQDLFKTLTNEHNNDRGNKSWGADK